MCVITVRYKIIYAHIYYTSNTLNTLIMAFTMNGLIAASDLD